MAYLRTEIMKLCRDLFPKHAKEKLRPVKIKTYTDMSGISHQMWRVYDYFTHEIPFPPAIHKYIFWTDHRLFKWGTKKNNNNNITWIKFE